MSSRSRTYAILIGIVLLTLPCYCGGIYLLSTAPREDIVLTPPTLPAVLSPTPTDTPETGISPGNSNFLANQHATADCNPIADSRTADGNQPANPGSNCGSPNIYITAAHLYAHTRAERNTDAHLTSTPLPTETATVTIEPTATMSATPSPTDTPNRSQPTRHFRPIHRVLSWSLRRLRPKQPKVSNNGHVQITKEAD